MLCQLWLERYKQTAQSHNSFSESATIINSIHPLHGQSLTVHRIHQLGKLTKVIFEHPDGGLISVPLSETSLELPQPSPQIGGVTPRFDPKKLRQLTVLVSNLGSTASTGTEDEEVVNREIDAKAACNTQSQNRRQQRKPRAIDPPDSSLSRKNPRPKTDVAKANEEGN
jgi:hypothetical protein